MWTWYKLISEIKFSITSMASSFWTFHGVSMSVKHLSNCWQLLCEAHLIFQICLATESFPLSLQLWEGFLIVCVRACACIYDRTEPMTGTSAQPSPRNKECWWVSLQPLLLSHTLINNHTESLPWPGGEKGEKRALLGSSSPLMPSNWPFSKGQSVQPQLHTATFRSPLSL